MLDNHTTTTVYKVKGGLSSIRLKADFDFIQKGLTLLNFWSVDSSPMTFKSKLLRTDNHIIRLTRIALTILIVMVSNLAFSQLVITSGPPDDFRKSKTTYDIDTLTIKNDSVFVVVKQYYKKVLIFEEEQIFIKDKVIFHGQSRQWFKSGKKKSEGKFNYGKKWGLWSYWDEKGNLSQDTDQLDQEIKLRGVIDFYYIDGVKVKLRKENE